MCFDDTAKKVQHYLKFWNYVHSKMETFTLHFTDGSSHPVIHQTIFGVKKWYRTRLDTRAQTTVIYLQQTWAYCKSIIISFILQKRNRYRFGISIDINIDIDRPAAFGWFVIRILVLQNMIITKKVYVNHAVHYFYPRWAYWISQRYSQKSYKCTVL